MQLQSLQQKAQSYEGLLGEIISQATVQENISIQNVFKKHFEKSPEVFSELLASESMKKHYISMPSSRISLDYMFFEFVSEDGQFPRSILKEPPIKVNSIESWTSLSFSYRLNHITDRREEKVLGHKLYDQIQLLWEKEKSNPSLPTIQSGILLGLLSCTFGLDRLGTQFIMHGAKSYTQQGLHIPLDQSSYGKSSDKKRDLSPTELSQEMVSWAIFDLQALASQVYRKESPWSNPPPLRCSPEQAARLDENMEWTPYPFESPVSRPHYYTTLQFRSALAVIVNEIANFALKFPGPSMSSDDEDHCYQIYQRLVDWKASLPKSVSPEYNTTPHVLCLHFYYQATLLSLSNLFTSNSTSSLESDDQDIGKIDFDLVTSEAMESIGSLVLLSKHRYGWKSIPIVMLHYFCVAGVHATSRLDENNPKWTLVLESCVVGLWHMSLGWGRLCKAFLRTIELVLKSNNPDPELIPIKVVAIFKHLNNDLWSATDLASLSADYVVQQVARKVNTPSTHARHDCFGVIVRKSTREYDVNMTFIQFGLPNLR
ncbi:hypothetical protein N7475_008854 [Penicillium sp. IBT 31633x]|nr:hypothetical protein N7475_008854 [Penicillium sp. IBT 31633x]